MKKNSRGEKINQRGTQPLNITTHDDIYTAETFADAIRAVRSAADAYLDLRQELERLAGAGRPHSEKGIKKTAGFSNSGKEGLNEYHRAQLLIVLRESEKKNGTLNRSKAIKTINAMFPAGIPGFGRKLHEKNFESILAMLRSAENSENGWYRT